MHHLLGLLIVAAFCSGCRCTAEPRGIPGPLAADRVLLESATMRLEERHWEWEGEQGTAWCVRLPRHAPMRIAPSSDVRWLHEIVSDVHDGMAIVNGGFYDPGPMGLVVSDGRQVAPLTGKGGSGVLIWDGLSVQVIHQDDWHGQAPQALQSIDRLVVGGKSVVRRREGARRAARSAIAIAPDAVWLVVHAADVSVTKRTSRGARISDPYDHGMPLWAFSNWLIEATDADYAINMDGGFSTNLIVRAAGESFQVTGVDGTINAVVFELEQPEDASN